MCLPRLILQLDVAHYQYHSLAYAVCNATCRDDLITWGCRRLQQRTRCSVLEHIPHVLGLPRASTNITEALVIRTFTCFGKHLAMRLLRPASTSENYKVFKLNTINTHRELGAVSNKTILICRRVRRNPVISSRSSILILEKQLIKRQSGFDI